MERNKNAMLAGSLAAAAILIVVAIVVVRIVVQRFADSRAAAPSGTASDEASEEAALKAAEPINPAMIGYHETAGFRVAFREPRALAVDADAQIYVGGDRAIERFSADGKKLAEIALEGEPRCLVVGALEPITPGHALEPETPADEIERAKPDHALTPARPGHSLALATPKRLLYVGMEDHVEVYDPAGVRLAVWTSRGPDAIFTSITTTEDEVWVADAGNRLVWRLDVMGHLLEPVGQPDPSQRRVGFLVTNHYFDLAAGTNGLVYVVNPRLLRVEGYMQSGELETTWGKGSSAVADFFGCCNPAQLAVLPDGRFVTAEKGIPRVKVYSRRGNFETVVAGPPQLTDTPADLAADSRGRVLVLDGRAAKVRVFEKNSNDKEKKKEDKEEKL